MIETLLRALDLRTGRFTSPHLERMSERISVDGEPLDDEAFVRAFNDVAPYTHLVDADAGPPAAASSRRSSAWPTPRSPTPRSTSPWSRSGWAAAWDATNVIDADVAVVLPIAVDHAKYLGDDAVSHRGREGRDHQARLVRRARPSRRPRSPRSCSRSAAEVGATVAREGMEFGVVVAHARRRRPGDLAAGASRATYDDVFLPLYGAHQAQNAAVALAAVEAFVGDAARSTTSVVRAAFAEVTSPGRLEIIRRSPTILLDAAHNPHGAEAAAAALRGLLHVQPAGRRDRA